MDRSINYFLFILMILTGCSSNEKPKISSQKPKTIHLKNTTTKVSLNDFVKSITVLKLQTDINIAEIHKVMVFNETFYVLDKKTSQLLVFNKDGKFIRKIGSRGHGPGEYTRLTDFTIDKKNNELFLFSSWDSKILKYNIKGKFISDFKIKNYPDSFILTPSGDFIFYTAFNNENLYSVVYTNKKGKPLKHTFPFPKGTMIVSAGYTGGLHQQGKTNYFTEMTSSLIYKIDDVITPKYQFDFGSSTWSEDKRFNIKDFFHGDAMKFSYLENYYCDTEDVLAFSFMHKRFKRRGFYFKKTGNYLAVPYNVKPDDLLYRILHLPIGIRENEFISSLDNELFEIVSESKENSEYLKKHRPDFYNAIKNFQPEDNPYLIFYEVYEKK